MTQPTAAEIDHELWRHGTASTTYGHRPRPADHRPRHRRPTDTAAMSLLGGIWLGMTVLGTVMTAR